MKVTYTTGTVVLSRGLSNGVLCGCEVDFFEHEGVYDGGYDYTFLCALPPDVRPKWAEKWTELLVSGGILLTIVFPIIPGRNHGPPWHIDQSIVTELLHKSQAFSIYLSKNHSIFVFAADFDLVLEEKVPNELSKPDRAGKEVVMVWKKK